jgi:uncharacterized protein YjbJ (UPF0337 family)
MRQALDPVHAVDIPRLGMNAPRAIRFRAILHMAARRQITAGFSAVARKNLPGCSQPAAAQEPARKSGVCPVSTPTLPEEIAMNWDQIEGKWKELKGKAIEKWGDLTDDEVDQVAGRREQMVGLVQQKYGRTKEEAEREVEEWHRGL